MAGGGGLGCAGSSQSERDHQYCELCGKMENLLRCGRCRSSFYCSKAHQRQDWKKHKLVCNGEASGTEAKAAGKSAEPTPPPPPAQNDPCADSTLLKSDKEATVEKTESLQAPNNLPRPRSKQREVVVGGATLRAINEEDYTQKSGEACGSSASRPGDEGVERPNGHNKPLLQKLALEYIIPCMNKHGICVLDDFLGQEIGERIVSEVKALHSTGRFTDGQLVSQKRDSTRDIRGDQITWVEGKEAACKAIGHLMTSMDDLIRHCGSKLGNFRINGRTKILMDLWDKVPAHFMGLRSTSGSWILHLNKKKYAMSNMETVTSLSSPFFLFFLLYVYGFGYLYSNNFIEEFQWNKL
ncbi:egl nine homolog 1 isoform X2 [Rhinoderma darwinii]|uniref:egl nine homolog 1 isoform X2 n=1 Tax=Rhinoderma darwinii TaxID=43563 RepID=UPI003F6612BF